MPAITRRSCLQRLAFTLSASAVAPLIPAARAADEKGPAPSEAETAAIAEIASKFMEEHEVPGLSVAFACQGQPAYSAGFGLADTDSKEKVTPDHLFRIASVSKPLTSVAIYTLIEDGKLKLDDKVFGAKGLLPKAGGKSATEGIEGITLHHLLTHTCGGWGNDHDDPMFSHPEMDHRDLIARTIQDLPLEHEPGSHYAYSNFGYCVLGRVIEKVSGKSYEDSLRKGILKRAGIEDMKIGGNTLAERARKEVVYQGRGGENPYGMNVRRMDSHGGWLATPGDLVKFLVHTSDAGAASDLLHADTVKNMITASGANAGYASGWAVNASHNRWHNGSLPGTSTIAVHTASGMCWAGFTNARGKGIDGALDQMMWQMAKAVPAWQA